MDFGFLFCRVLTSYGLGYRELMEVPINAFWLLNSSISRLSAEKDIRALTVASSTQASEMLKQTRENLVVEMGEVAKISPVISAVRDEQGFQKLKAMAAA